MTCPTGGANDRFDRPYDWPSRLPLSARAAEVDLYHGTPLASGAAIRTQGLLATPPRGRVFSTDLAAMPNSVYLTARYASAEDYARTLPTGVRRRGFGLVIRVRVRADRLMPNEDWVYDLIGLNGYYARQAMRRVSSRVDWDALAAIFTPYDLEAPTVWKEREAELIARYEIPVWGIIRASGSCRHIGTILPERIVGIHRVPLFPPSDFAGGRE